MARGKNKAKPVQVRLTDVGWLPLLKKPHEQVGKIIKVPGAHWGSACPPSDRNKEFQCTILDHSIAYHDEEEDDSTPYEAMQLQEMGVDGGGGNSDPFWMKYPAPFLTFYYKTFPDEKAPPAQVVHGNEGGGADTNAPAVADGAEGEQPPKQNEIYKYLRFIGSEKKDGRLRSKFTCCISGNCGGSVTIFGKSTGPFFKHVRRKAKSGDAAHAKVMDELNMLSCRQVQMPNGEYVTVWTFEECFPHHVDFMWLVAGGLSMRLNRRPIFLQYVRGYEPRIVLPHNETVHRLATITDELQMASNRTRRGLHVSRFKGLPCIGLQVDLWTDRNSGIAYAALHSSHVDEPVSSIELDDASLEQRPSFQLKMDLLHFKAFPFTAHTSDNIKEWLVAVLLAEELPATCIAGVTPDGASDGQSGIKSVPGLANKVDVCVLHDQQRCVLYAVGLAGPKQHSPNQDARDLLRSNGRVVQLSHQSREVSDGFRNFQADHEIPASKILSTVRTNATRWTNQKKQITRNCLMQPIIDPVLKKYRREHAGDTSIIEKDSSGDDSESAVPRGPYTQASRAVTRRDIRLSEEQWNANLELEGFLAKPATIKETLEHRPTVTGAQGGVCS